MSQAIDIDSEESTVRQIGSAFFDGQGAERNLEESLFWYKKLLPKGHKGQEDAKENRTPHALNLHLVFASSLLT